MLFPRGLSTRASRGLLAAALTLLTVGLAVSVVRPTWPSSDLRATLPTQGAPCRGTPLFMDYRYGAGTTGYDPFECYFQCKLEQRFFLVYTNQDPSTGHLYGTECSKGPPIDPGTTCDDWGESQRITCDTGIANDDPPVLDIVVGEEVSASSATSASVMASSSSLAEETSSSSLGIMVLSSSSVSTVLASSASSTPVVMQECRGDECYLGGDGVCANVDRDCVTIDILPCMACVPTSGSAPFCSDEACANAGSVICGRFGKECVLSSTLPCFECEGTLPARSSLSPVVYSSAAASFPFFAVSSAARRSSVSIIRASSSSSARSVAPVPRIVRSSRSSVGGPTHPSAAGSDADGISVGRSSSVAPPVCGNGKKEEGEQCDPPRYGRTGGGAQNGGQDARCAADCTLKEGIVARCGDGVTEGKEECDDGPLNGANGALCSAACSVLTVRVICGDGTIDGGEGCDDGNVRDNDGCDHGCKIEEGVPCGFPSTCATGICARGFCRACATDQDCGGSACTQWKCVALCGNGRIDPGEQCDSGRRIGSSDDGCMTGCRLQEGIIPRCGDGILESGEECDEGMANGTVGGTCDQACAWRPEAVAGASFGDAYHPAGETASIIVSSTGRAPAGQTGPAAIGLMAVGAAAGFAWMKKRRKKV